ncbi:MAG: hypothetical protein JWO85_2474 [Candidatus Eremiobacteraeota bacterium]|nr:hypothetical protein [Candidatus Eremiobacteraeota bacterium]
MNEAGPLTDTGGTTEETGPHVVGLFCAANISFDPYHRLSAHAVFSRVRANALPFHFEEPVYLIISIRGATDGARMVALEPKAGVLDFAAETNSGDPVTFTDGLAVFAFSVISCVVYQAGPQYLTLSIDGKPMEPVFAFQVDLEEAR